MVFQSIIQGENLHQLLSRVKKKCFHSHSIWKTHILTEFSESRGCLCPKPGPRVTLKNPSQHQEYGTDKWGEKQGEHRLWVRNIFYNPQDMSPAQVMQSILQDSPEQPLLIWIVLLGHSKDLSRLFSLPIYTAQGGMSLFPLAEPNPVFLFFTPFPPAITTTTQSKDWQWIKGRIYKLSGWLVVYFLPRSFPNPNAQQWRVHGGAPADTHQLPLLGRLLHYWEKPNPGNCAGDVRGTKMLPGWIFFCKAVS